jgi:dUTP pyrophosphatase
MNFFNVKRLSETAVIPSRGSKNAAGYDLYANENVFVPIWAGVLVSTGIAISFPDGHYARVASRSGLSVKNNLEVGAGVIDSDYRGEIKVVIRNHSDIPFSIKIGDRIAQLIIEKIITPDVNEVNDLTDTVRGANGFGSTGVGSTGGGPSSIGLTSTEHWLNFVPIGTASEGSETIGNYIKIIKESNNSKCFVCDKNVTEMKDLCTNCQNITFDT